MNIQNVKRVLSSIRVKLLSSIVCVIALSIISILIVNFNYFKTEQEKEIKYKFDQVEETVNKILLTKRISLLNISRVVGENRDLHKLFKNAPKEEIEKYVSNFSHKSYIPIVDLVDIHGNKIFSYRDSYKKRESFVEALAYAEAQATSTLDNYGDSIALLTITPIVVNNKKIGFFVLGEYLDEYNATEIYEITNTPMFFMHGNKIQSPKKIKHISKGIYNIWKKGDPKKKFTFTHNNFLIQSVPILNIHADVIGHRLVGFQLSKFFHKQYLLAVTIFKYGSLVLLLGLFFAFFISRGLIRPLEKLTSKIKGIVSSGDMDQVVEISRSDEIGELSNSFNQLMSSLKSTTISKEFVDQIFESMNDFLIVINENGEVVKTNTSYSKFINQNEKALKGKLFSKFLPAETNKKLKFEMKNKAGKVFEQKIYNYNKEKVDVLISVSEQVSSKNEHYFIILMKEISDIKQIQEELEAQKAISTQAAKLSQLGEMASNVAHEINNPLTIISGNVQMLMKMMKSGKLTKAKFEKKIENIEKNTTRITKIVAGMRKMSRDSSEDEHVAKYLYELVEEAVDLCSNKSKKYGVPLTFDIDQQIQLKCNEIQISQIFVNLINNGIDAICELHEKFIRIEATHTSDSVEIRIIDSGNGIAESVAEKIFTPFFTTKEIGSGTGLGLSISKGIIESHNGSFELDRSHPNTCFVIKLPKNLDVKVDLSKIA